MINAIILAAGKSDRFAPFTYERPKGLFRVKGEVLIERQIQQLQRAGIRDIYVVVGYMKEKFFYLENKYGIKLIINNEFGRKGNIYSLYVARDYLSNTFICCADHYFIRNPFTYENPDNHSYRVCSFQKGKFREFAVKCSDADVITKMTVGGNSSLAMVGPAYMNEQFSKRFKELMEREINDFGVDSLFWEEFYAKHSDQLTFYKREIDSEDIMEFDSIEDLRKFDSEFLMNVDSEIINNICKIIKCNPNDISDITIINAGLTNVSFAFQCNNQMYVYRHPGGNAGCLIDRRSEVYAQKIAKKIDVDNSVIYMDLDGWKISHYITTNQSALEVNINQVEQIMKYLHKLHSVKVDKTIKVFDNVEEGKRLMAIATCTKGNLFKEFADIIGKIDRLYALIKKDAIRLGYGLVLCHNDVYDPNFICDNHGKMYLIDWEYAGLNYAANDIGGILCRYDWSDAQIEYYLKLYFGRDLTIEEHRYYMAFIPISAFYWFCWGLYKGSVGDDDSFFFLSTYRNLIRFIDSALESYEESEE